MSRILIHTTYNEITRQLVEEVRDFLGQTYPVLYRYPVTACLSTVGDIFPESIILRTFVRQRPVKVNAKGRVWHYNGDRAFLNKPGDQPEPCKWHIFPCMLQQHSERHGRSYKTYNKNVEKPLSN